MTSNEEWLKSLKPGDRVYYTRGLTNGIKTVERLTPTRRVILKGHHGQFINGTHKMDAWNFEHITELTDERKTDFYNRIKKRKIKEYDWKEASIDTIDNVYVILYETE